MEAGHALRRRRTVARQQGRVCRHGHRQPPWIEGETDSEGAENKHLYFEGSGDTDEAAPLQEVHEGT